jgi:hypothetical protein
MDVLGLEEEDILAALVGCFGPPQPSGVVSYWKKHDYYGNSSPTTELIKNIYEKNDYRCTKCGSQIRLTIDHKNGDPTDHNESNLKLLCLCCNRKKSTRSIKTENHKLKIYLCIVDFFNENGRVPTYREIQDISGIKNIGGARYFMKYVQKRLSEK